MIESFTVALLLLKNYGMQGYCYFVFARHKATGEISAQIWLKEIIVF